MQEFTNRPIVAAFVIAISDPIHFKQVKQLVIDYCITLDSPYDKVFYFRPASNKIPKWIGESVSELADDRGTTPADIEKGIKTSLELFASLDPTYFKDVYVISDSFTKRDYDKCRRGIQYDKRYGSEVVVHVINVSDRSLDWEFENGKYDAVGAIKGIKPFFREKQWN